MSLKFFVAAKSCCLPEGITPHRMAQWDIWIQLSVQIFQRLLQTTYFINHCFEKNKKNLPIMSSRHTYHSCAILARIFWVLAWDLKISRYLGIVLRLSLNFIILGIGIEIEIEFWILQYWYWYWYLVLMFLILILRLRLKFLSPVSIIGIVSFHKLIKLCNQAVNS